MGKIIVVQEWERIIKTIEMHDRGLADTFALAADPELQALIKEGEKDIRMGKLIQSEDV